MGIENMRTLLLNYSYESMQFIPLRKALKLIIKDKVEVLSNWDYELRHGAGTMPHPSILRLKYYVPRHIKRRRYNRSGVFKRDKFSCKYCDKSFRGSELTIDHVVPKKLGGPTSWTNCVASCYECNNFKADRTPKQAKMKPQRPKAPAMTIWHEYDSIRNIHPEWKDYIFQAR